MQEQYTTRKTSEKPPVSNRGVQNTSGAQPPEFLIDYLRFTFPDETVSIDYLLPGAESLDWVELPYGHYGYMKCKVAGGVRVYTNHHSLSGGVCVQISGEGCRELEGAGLVTDWVGYLAYLLGIGAGISRFDLALDDTTAACIDIDRVIEHLRDDAVVKRWVNWSLVQSQKGSKAPIAKTVYIGSRKSAAFLRIYDKAAEQGTDEHWVRVELELKDERARAMASAIVDGASAGEVFAGVLRGYIDFKVEGEDSNKSRWETVDWWLAFLGAVEKVRLGCKPIVRTLEQVDRWLRKAVAPSLAMIVQADGGALERIFDYINDGKQRWRTRHRIMLAGLA